MNKALLIGSAALLLACGGSVTTTVANPDNEGTTASTSTSSGPGAGGAGGAEVSVTTTTTTTTSTGMGGAMGASALLIGSDPVTLVMTSYPITCATAEMQPPFGQCDWYSVQIKFSASFLVPGGQPISDTNTYMTAQSSGDPNSPTPGDCPGTGEVSGGGSVGMPNELTIVSVDGQSLVVDVEGLAPLLDGDAVDGTLDGQHVVTRCPSQ